MFGEDEPYADTLPDAGRAARHQPSAWCSAASGRTSGVSWRRSTCSCTARVIPEPFGQVVVEGMAAGVPVIAADAGGPAEIVTDEVDGLLTPPGDVEALAAAMRRVHNDRALRRRLVSGRIRETRSTIHPSDTAQALLAVYESVVAGWR